jgi:hypothetical protein
VRQYNIIILISEVNVMTKRKTDAEFKKEVFDLVGDEYIFLDPYVNANTKIKVKHNKCGHAYKVTPSNFLMGSRCPVCSLKVEGKARRKTNIQFKKEVLDLVGNDYVFLDPYVNARTKIRVKHNKCGNTYKVIPSKFLNGRRCPYCFGKHKKTDAQFKKDVFDLVGNEYTFLDNYVNNHTKIRVKHNKCNNIYDIKPNDFLTGHRCPYCSAGARRKVKGKTDAEFKQEVYNLVGDEYTFLDSYVNTHTKLRVKHNECGHIYEVAPSNFLSGRRCPICLVSGRDSKTDAQFKQEVYALVGDEYIFLDPYVNSGTKIRVKHNTCGHIYGVRPTDFISHHTRCPYCNSPKGELIISKILNKLSIPYEPQKTFSDLKDTQSLSYDFYIPSQAILIEYQGIQHYQPIDYFGGDDRFVIQQKHDKMKFDYAENNDYNLIAIPYTIDTFSKIKKYLIKHGLKLH